jgi:hypothetical protein
MRQWIHLSLTYRNKTKRKDKIKLVNCRWFRNKVKRSLITTPTLKKLKPKVPEHKLIQPNKKRVNLFRLHFRKKTKDCKLWAKSTLIPLNSFSRSNCQHFHPAKMCKLLNALFFYTPKISSKNKITLLLRHTQNDQVPLKVKSDKVLQVILPNILKRPHLLAMSLWVT